MNPVGNALAPILSRFGREVPIQRFNETGQDRLNHGTGSWELVGNTVCAKYHPSENEQQALASGARDTDEPHLIFEKGEDIQDGDRVFFPGVTYQIKALTQTHGYILATVQATG